MKALFCSLLLLFSTQSKADPLWDENGITTNGKLELAYQAAAIGDWSQTRYIAENPDNYRELNVFLGEHPTVGQVDAWFIGTGLAHAIVSNYIPKEYATIWQVSSILVEIGMVIHNHSIGIEFAW